MCPTAGFFWLLPTSLFCIYIKLRAKALGAAEELSVIGGTGARKKNNLNLSYKTYRLRTPLYRSDNESILPP